MGAVKVTKLEAAQRQVNAAIRMLFDGYDAVAVHTVTAAAHQIVRDICRHRKDVESYLRFTDWIAPDHEKEFWGHVNRTANFLKHADKDSEATHEFEDKVAEFQLLFCCVWLRDLGAADSFEVKTYLIWLALCRPNILKASKEGHFGELILPADVSTWPRGQQLELGRNVLKKRQNPSA